MINVDDMRYLTKEEQLLYNEGVENYFKNFKLINVPMSNWNDVEL